MLQVRLDSGRRHRGILDGRRRLGSDEVDDHIVRRQANHPRWTAVLVREDDVWKFVQTHASIAVPNDQVGWSYD